MIDDELIAKVRAAAEETLADHSARCQLCDLGKAAAAVDGAHPMGIGPVPCRIVHPLPEVVCARAALALVEQWEWHRAERDRCNAEVRKAAGNAPIVKLLALAMGTTNGMIALLASAKAKAHSDAMSEIERSLREVVP